MTNAVPIVGWFIQNSAVPDPTNANNHIAVQQPFSFGQLDAGTDRTNPITKFFIWNNKGGATDVPKMEQCTITTRDNEFGDGTTVGKENFLVKDCWFRVQVDSLQQSDIDLDTSKVGKDKLKPIGTTGSTIKNNAGASITPITPATQEILGVNNNGVPNDGKGNFVAISTKIYVPLNAPSGRVNFKLRASYRYV